MKNPVFDKDLTTLFRNSENIDLEPIVETILAAPSQTLTVKSDYKEHMGDHKAYIDALVYEIQSFGGNSLANLVRGHGVPYVEMVRDVAKKLGIKPSLTDTVATLEEKVLLKIIRMSYELMDESDRLALADLFDLGNTAGDKIEFGAEFPEAEISRHLADGATSLMGDRIHHAVELAARSARLRRSIIGATRLVMAKLATASLGGPLSWTAAIGQGIYELFGPNYTTALALVANVALIRQKQEQLQRDQIGDETPETISLEEAS